MNIYQVGGSIRDEILGIKSKDIDYTVVLTGNEDGWHTMGGNDPFNVMVYELETLGFKIFLKTAEYLTVRARFPKNHKHSGLTADFVLARKEGEYSDGRRPDVVTPGTLLDDQSRRDFTMNSVAKAEDGTLIDPYNGVQDITNGLIRAVGKPLDRFNEDALRAVRALRFSVTKHMRINDDVKFAMETQSVLNAIEKKISDERVREELDKMFKYDTLASLKALERFSNLTRAMFAGNVNLMPTMKMKGYK